jgi:hypothetical protein
MQGTADPVFIEECAGGDDLCLDGEIAGAFHLAEIWRPTGPHQCLEPPLPLGTHDLYLEIPAAGGAPGIVCGTAGRQSAWIGALEDGKAVLGGM